jgi:hypothetical protein
MTKEIRTNAIIEKFKTCNYIGSVWWWWWCVVVCGGMWWCVVVCGDVWWWCVVVFGRANLSENMLN